MIIGHGDDYGIQSELIANFSTNIPASCKNDALLQYLSETMLSVTHYPDPDASELAQRLAQKYGIDAASVLVTNGATEAFYLLAELFQGKHSLIFTPSFAEYEDACERYSHKITYASNAKYASFSPSTYDLVWLCNPNNPDGKLLDLQLLKRWLNEAPNTTFILDEAYVELAYNVSSILPELHDYPNLVVVRSMTKRYVIPGLRLGFIAAEQALLQKIKPMLMPWRINQMAIEAGYFIASNQYADGFCEQELTAESQWLQKQINAIKGFEVVPSTMNYFLVIGEKSASDLKSWLLSNYQILIRDASNFRGLNAHYFRIATGNRQQNKMLIQALQQWSRI